MKNGETEPSPMGDAEGTAACKFDGKNSDRASMRSALWTEPVR